MIKKLTLDNSIDECRKLLLKMEEAAEYAPGESIYFKRYPSGHAVPYLVTGPRDHRCMTRIDPDDSVLLHNLMRKTFARKILPQLRKDLKLLEHANGYQEIEFYKVAALLGPEYRSCADFFLGYPDRIKTNPAFDALIERQNKYEFDSNTVRTELGIFSESEEYGFDIAQAKKLILAFCLP